MVSVVITTYKELNTLPKALEAIKKEKVADEILVVAPDQETEDFIKENYSKASEICLPALASMQQRSLGLAGKSIIGRTKFDNNFGRVREGVEVRFFKNERIVKPAAINLAFRQAKGEIVVLTDGDVIIKEGSIKLLVRALEKKENGLACGRPVSVDPSNNLFGYWSHFLCFAAHQMRSKNKIFPASGNLCALKKNLFSSIPEETMIDDALLTQIVLSKGYQVVYLKEAEVFVKYPKNFKDWLKQKIRATGGYLEKLQITNYKLQMGKMRNFGQEIKEGVKLFFVYPKNLREFFWTILLYLARIYLWFLIFWQIKIKKRGAKDLWQRVESTK